MTPQEYVKELERRFRSDDPHGAYTLWLEQRHQQDEAAFTPDERRRLGRNLHLLLRMATEPGWDSAASVAPVEASTRRDEATTMASAPELADRNDMTLWASRVMLDDLLTRANGWDRRPASERLDFFLEWEELTDRLAGVAADGDAARLTGSQLDQLQRLAEQLMAARVTIERLGLDYPDLGQYARAS